MTTPDNRLRKTVRVRIAVAMLANGRYDVACKYSGDSDESAEDVVRRWVLESLGNDPIVVHHVPATLPLPQGVEVEGEVGDG